MLKWSLTSCWWPKFRHLVKAVLPLWVMEKEESPKGGDSLPVLATYLQYVLNHCWRNALRAYMNWRILCYFACFTPCFWMPEGTWHESCLMTKIPYKHWILNINSSNLEMINEPKHICCWNRCTVLSCESSWEHGDLCLGNSWTRKTQNDPMNCCLGVLPWMMLEIAVLVEGPAQKSQWWEVMTFCPGCTENVWCNRWVYCWRVGNSNTNCNDFIHDVCIKCSRYIYLFFSLLWSSSDTRTANSECCPFRHLAMNLSIERITEGFTNESHLGSVSSHDLISRDSSG